MSVPPRRVKFIRSLRGLTAYARRRARARQFRLCDVFDQCTWCLGSGSWNDGGFRSSCGECMGYGDRKHQIEGL